MDWLVEDDHAAELLGYIPGMLSEDDPRPAREQLHSGYIHGGGWQPFSGVVRFDPKTRRLLGQGSDPDLPLQAMAVLRDEAILVYEHALVLILQRDGTYEVARMD